MFAILSILFVSLLGTPQASVLPNDFDEVVLLQQTFRTKSQHANTIVQEPFELTQESMAEQLDSIQKKLQEQPDGDNGGDGDGNVGGGGPQSGNVGEEGLQMVKEMLESQMEAYLVFLHVAAEKEWQTATDLSAACGAHRARRFNNITGDVALAERAVHQARLKHQACRKSEKAWNFFHMMSYSSPADLGVHNVDAASIAFSQAVTRAQLQAQAYNDIAPAGMHECLVDQINFEMSSCTRAAKGREACNAYTTCIAGVGLADMQSRLLVDSSGRRNLWKTIGTLKCRIDQMMMVGSSDEAVGTTNFTDPCADIVVNTAHLVLALPFPPSNDCSDEQLPPLTSPSTEDSAQCAVWMGTEYTWDPSDAVLPEACAATCFGVHPPQPPPDCEDASAQCKFYQQHPSACGSFSNDGQDFEACTDCCYCRFSPACGHCPPGYKVHQGGTACQECPEGQIATADSVSCVDPQPCVASVDCSGHGTTDDLDKSDGCSCSCGGGYSGFDCSTPPPCDATVDCSGHGATIDLDNTDGCDCACNDGFEGADCATASIQGVPPVNPFFNQATTCTTVWTTRRAAACPSPAAPQGWVRIVEYQDDECTRDIPNSPSVNSDSTGVDGIETWQAGFANTNAVFLGAEKMSTLVATGAYTRGAWCLKASRSDCNGGCYEFDASYLLSTASDWGDWGLCGEYGDKSDLEKIILYLAGACACQPSATFSQVLSADFSGPIGSDDKPLSTCTGGTGLPYTFPCQYGISWHVHGYALTMKNSDYISHGLGVGDELTTMYKGSDCGDASADTGSNIDSMWLYLGTADAAVLAA